MFANSANRNNSFIVGIGRIILINVYLSVLLIPLSLVIGLLQLIYVIPWCRRLNRKEKKEMCKGIITGAVISLLLNSACYGFVLWLLVSLSGGH